MNRIATALILVLAPCALALAQSEAPETAAAPETPTFLTETGCATCSYKMPNVTGCKTAVKLGDTAYLVEGVETNAHADGLCDATKHAHVAGVVEKGRFVAIAYQIEENPDPAELEAAKLVDAELGCASCTYKMEGVKGCKTAVKLGDTAHLVQGANLDAHASGLCTAPKPAKVAGHLNDDGTYQATILIPQN